MTRVLFLIFFAVFQSACTGGSADFTSFLGDWRCNVELTVREQVAVAPLQHRDFAEKLAKSINSRGEKDKEPPHANIHVTKSRIIGTDAVLEPQYDILRAEIKKGVLIARVRYHEERHDQGDFVELTIHLRRLGERFVLEVHVDEMPIPLVYVFERK